MAKNFKQDGDTLLLTPAANVNSGTGYLFGAALFGVALADVTSGQSGPFRTSGVFDLPKTAALAINVGDRVFWDAANNVVNKTTTAQQCVGVAVETVAGAAATVKVKLGHHVPSAT